MLDRHLEDHRPWGDFAAQATALSIRLAGRFRNWRDGSNAIWHLRRLDDHLLADLGLEREEIARRVRGRR